MFNDIGIELEANLPDIQQFEEYIFTIEKELPSIHQLLTETKDDANKADEIMNKANKLMPEAKEMVSSGIRDRKSTRLNSSHVAISYAVFCLKKKKKKHIKLEHTTQEGKSL